MTVLVKRIGGSLAVVIPRAVATDAGLEVGTPLEVTNTADGILLQAARRRPRRSTRDIVAQINTHSYGKRSAELLQDRAVGKELG